MHYSRKALAGIAFTLLASAPAHATTVQFQTVMGDFEVNLFDKTTPETVANFLEYVESGAYQDTFIHRSVPGFVVQGGGFSFDVEEDQPGGVDTNPAVVNEPVYSNQRGTIAMAKLGGNPNSATSQWFFNLGDNSENLDNQNGGFTVFGQVTGNGMAIIDAMGDLPTVDAGNAYTNLPLRNFAEGDEITIDEDYLVMIQNIVVLDASEDTTDGLNPKLSTKDDNNGSDGGSNGGGGGGGSTGLLGLLALAGLGVRKLLTSRA